MLTILPRATALAMMLSALASAPGLAAGGASHRHAPPMFFEGEYRSDLAYEIGAVVRFEGETYVAIAPSAAGDDPANNASGAWEFFVANGNDGNDGNDGEPGPVGPPGLDGSPGARGPAGPPGLDGEPGSDGEPGRDGTSGVPGAPGEAGPPGSSGQPGEPGTDGPPGADGLLGPAGPAGTDGEQGQAGAPGPSGTQGQPGAPGAPGTPGSPGATGAAGANAICPAVVTPCPCEGLFNFNDPSVTWSSSFPGTLFVGFTDATTIFNDDFTTSLISTFDSAFTPGRFCGIAKTGSGAFDIRIPINIAQQSACFSSLTAIAVARGIQ